MNRSPSNIPARAGTKPAVARVIQSNDEKVSTELSADGPAEEPRGHSVADVEQSEQSATGQAEADPSTSAAKFARANLKNSSEPDTGDKATDNDPGPRDDSEMVDASTSGDAPAEPHDPMPTKTKLELAIDRCTALGDKSDTMVSEKWAKRAPPILVASLTFLAEYKAATEAGREAVRALLKAKSGVSRQPNIDNLPLIAVYMCVSCSDKTRTKKQRKAWGRFKTVVAVAAAVPIDPDGAAQWLEKRTLNGILAEWRDIQDAAGKAARKRSVPKALKDFTHLAAALAEDSNFRTLANEELAKADAIVAKAMSEAATTAAAASTAEAAANA